MEIFPQPKVMVKFTIVLGCQYRHRKKRVGAPENNSNAQKQFAQNEQIESKKYTAEQLAEENNVSRETLIIATPLFSKRGIRVCWYG